eukprot:1150595-Pelagomonas_calceolata.AAC.6
MKSITYYDSKLCVQECPVDTNCGLPCEKGPTSPLATQYAATAQYRNICTEAWTHRNRILQEPFGYQKAACLQSGRVSIGVYKLSKGASTGVLFKYLLWYSTQAYREWTSKDSAMCPKSAHFSATCKSSTFLLSSNAS